MGSRPMPTRLLDLLARDENLSSDARLRLTANGGFESADCWPAAHALPSARGGGQLFEEKNVSLNTPTGSGKSRVAPVPTGAVSCGAVFGSANKV
jgi:hypothetical protein